MKERYGLPPRSPLSREGGLSTDTNRTNGSQRKSVGDGHGGLCHGRVKGRVALEGRADVPALGEGDHRGPACGGNGHKALC